MGNVNSSPHRLSKLLSGKEPITSGVSVRFYGTKCTSDTP
jgi:hypothetical protein